MENDCRQQQHKYETNPQPPNVLEGQKPKDFFLSDQVVVFFFFVTNQNSVNDIHKKILKNQPTFLHQIFFI